MANFPRTALRESGDDNGRANFPYSAATFP